MKTQSKILFSLLVFAALILFGIDFFIEKHEAHFIYESIEGFYAIYGFLAFIVLVVLAKYVLRPIVFRDKDFYE